MTDVTGDNVLSVPLVKMIHTWWYVFSVVDDRHVQNLVHHIGRR